MNAQEPLRKVSFRKIVLMAAVNPSFRKKLISGRDRFLAEYGLRLSKIEEQTLCAMSESALENLIKSVRAGSEKER